MNKNIYYKIIFFVFSIFLTLFTTYFFVSAQSGSISFEDLEMILSIDSENIDSKIKINISLNNEELLGDDLSDRLSLSLISGNKISRFFGKLEFPISLELDSNEDYYEFVLYSIFGDFIDSKILNNEIIKKKNVGFEEEITEFYEKSENICSDLIFNLSSHNLSIGEELIFEFNSKNHPIKELLKEDISISLSGNEKVYRSIVSKEKINFFPNEEGKYIVDLWCKNEKLFSSTFYVYSDKEVVIKNEIEKLYDGINYSNISRNFISVARNISSFSIPQKFNDSYFFKINNGESVTIGLEVPKTKNNDVFSKSNIKKSINSSILHSLNNEDKIEYMVEEDFNLYNTFDEQYKQIFSISPFVQLVRSFDNKEISSSDKKFFSVKIRYPSDNEGFLIAEGDKVKWVSDNKELIFYQISSEKKFVNTTFDSPLELSNISEGDLRFIDFGYIDLVSMTAYYELPRYFETNHPLIMTYIANETGYSFFGTREAEKDLKISEISMPISRYKTMEKGDGSPVIFANKDGIFSITFYDPRVSDNADYYMGLIEKSYVDVFKKYGIEIINSGNTIFYRDGLKLKLVGRKSLDGDYIKLGFYLDNPLSNPEFIRGLRGYLKLSKFFNIFGGLKDINSSLDYFIAEEISREISNNLGLQFVESEIMDEEREIYDILKAELSSNDWIYYASNNLIGDGVEKFEVELVLNEKPETNVFTYFLEAEDPDFFFQEDLSEEEKDQGYYVPENIKGSYAVYKDNNKLFHIYRPKIIDASGKVVWGELFIDKNLGILSIIVPQEFLNDAVYPVIIDPTFGYTSVGGSRVDFNDYIRGSVFELNEWALINQISTYIRIGKTTSANFRFALFDENDNLLYETSEGSGSGGVFAATSNWYTLSFSSSELISPGNYTIVAWGQRTVGTNELEMHYDSGSSGQGKSESLAYLESFPSSLSPSSESRIYSIFLNYTSVFNNITLNSPSANYNSYNLFVLFNFTPTSNVNYLNCSLWDNSTGIWGVAQTNTSSILNGTFNYFNKTYSAYGNYSWNVQCCNQVGCSFSDSNRTMDLEEEPPMPIENMFEDFYVQRGYHIMDSTTYDVSIEEVNVSNAFVLLSTRSNANSGHASMLLVTGELVDSGNGTSNTLRLTKYSTTATYVEWEIIESSSFFVQTGEASTSGTEVSSMNVDLSVPVNLSNSFIVVHSRMSNTNAGQFLRGFWTAEFVNSSRFILTRGATGTNSQVRWYVVSFDRAVVQSGTITASASPSIVNLPESFVTSKSFLLFQTRATDNDAQNLMVQGSIINSTSISFRKSGSGGTTTTSYYLIEHPSFSVVSGNYRNSSNGAIDNSLSSVDLTRSFSLNSYNSETSSTTWQNVFTTNQIAHKNILELEKYGATSINNNTWFVVQAVKTSSPPLTPRNLRIYEYEPNPVIAWEHSIKEGIATDYYVERAPDVSGVPGTYSLIGSVSSSATELKFEDSSAVSGSAYWYRVFASNENGNSSYSSLFFNESSKSMFADFYVQRGELSMTTTTIDIPVEEVNVSNAFVLLSTRSNANSGHASMLLVTGELVDSGNGTSNTLRLTKYSTTATYVEWEIIESSSFFVQTGEASTSGTEVSSMNVDLSVPVNLSNSFIVVHSRMSNTNAGQFLRGFWTAEFVNSSRFILTRGATGTNSQVRWYVVSMNGAYVQKGLSLSNTNSKKALLGRAINPERSFLMFQISATDTNAQSIMVQGYLYDNSTLSFLRSSETGTTKTSYYMIEHPSLKVQRGKFRNSDSGPQEISLSEAVSQARTFTLNNYNSETSSTTWQNIFTTNKLYDDSNIELEKYGATSINNYSWTVVEANKFNSPPSPPKNFLATDITKNSITLTWSPGEKGGIPDEYVLERALDVGGVADTYFEINRTPGLSFVDINVTFGFTYWYRVKAINNYGESDYSEEISETPSSGNIPRGSTRMTTTTLDVNIQAVNTSRAFVLLSTRPDSNTANPAVLKVTGEFINSTTLRFTRHATAPIYIDWEVVESADFFVQSGEISTPATGTSSMNVDLSVPVNLSNTFVIVHSRIPTTIFSEMVRSFWTAEFVNETRFTLSRGVTGTLSYVRWYVVSYNNSVVQSGTTTASPTPTSVTLGKSVDVTRAFMIFQTRATTTNALNIMVQGSIDDSNTISFRRSASAGTTTVSYYVIESDKINVQTGNYRTSDSGYQNITLSDIGLRRSFNVNSYNTENSTTTWRHVFPTNRLFNSTTLQLNKFDVGAVNNNTWFVISFSLPETRIISPINKTYGTVHFPLPVNVFLNEIGSSVIFTYDDWITNYSMSSSDGLLWNASIPYLDNGNYTLKVESEFPGGFIDNSQEINFTVDLSPFIVNITNPNEPNFNVSSLLVEAETNKDAEWCVVSLNNGNNITMNATNSTHHYSYLEYLKNDFYNLTVYCMSNDHLSFDSFLFQLNTDFEPRVQRNSETMSGVLLEVPVNLIDLSRSFLRFNVRTTENRPDRNQVLGYLNGTHIIFQRYNGGGTVYIEWEIVEHPDIYVQRGIGAYATGDGTINVPIFSSNPVNSFPIISGRLSSSTNSDNVRGYFTAIITNTTNLQLQRGVIGTLGEYSWQVISSDFITIQSGTNNPTSSGTVININEIEPLESFIITNYRSTSSSATDVFVSASFVNETQIVLFRGRDTGTTTAAYYVVHFPSSYVQSGNYRFTGTSAQNIAIQEINTSKSFNTVSLFFDTDTTSFGQSLISSVLTSSTNLQLQKLSGTGNINSSWFIIELNKFNLIKWISITDGKVYGYDDLDFNVSTYKDADSCWFSLDGNANQTLNKESGTYFYYKQENLSETSHNIIFYCNDSSSQEFSSELLQFSVDTSPLSVTILSPVSQIYNKSFIDINVSTNKDSESCFYSLNGQNNVSLQNISSNFFSSLASYLKEGNYLLTVYCEDITNFISSNSVSFSINIPTEIVVQRGSLTLPNTQNQVNQSILITDPSKAFLVFSSRSGSSQPSQIQIMGELTENELIFSRYSTSGDVYIEWEVVEHPNLYVQRGKYEYGTADSSINITTRKINLSSSFPIISNMLNSTTNNQNVRGYLSARFTNSSNIEVQRGETGNLGKFVWQVVDWKNTFVQSGSSSSASGTMSSTLSNSVNLSKSFLLFSRRISGATNLASTHVAGYFSSNSQVNFYRRSTDGTMYTEWFVVESDNFGVQSGFQYVSGGSPVYSSFSEINTSRAFSLNTFDTSGTGTTFANAQLSHEIFNETSLQYIKGTSSNNQNASWFVIELNYSPEIDFIEVISPVNGNYYNSSSLIFNISLYADVDSCWFSLDGGSNQSMVEQTPTSYYYNQTSLSENIHQVIFYCNDSSENLYEEELINFTIDLTPPSLILISPANNNQSSYNSVNFSYNASDNYGFERCSLIIDDEIRATDYFVQNNTISNFFVYLENGEHTWNINCFDLAGNSNLSETRNINVSSTQTYSWSNRFYETSTFDVNGETAYITLANLRDGTENNVSTTIIPSSVSTIVFATSGFLGNNGVIIPASSTVDFSGYMQNSKTNVLYVTWKVYYNNGSNPGDTLICQSGDDSIGGTRLSTTSGTWTSNCNTSSQIILSPGDRIKLEVNVYNSDISNSDITHIWDNLRLSFVEFSSFNVLGNLESELIFPETDLSVSVGDSTVVSCNVSCSAGTCYNTNIFVQYNTSSTSWSNVGGTGNIVLDIGQFNPVNLGNFQNNTIINFSIRANTESINNLRCVASSTYSSYNGSTIREILIKGYPQIQFVSPTPANNSGITTNYFVSNISINENNMDEFIFNFHGTNYSFSKNFLNLLNSGSNVDETIFTTINYSTGKVQFPLLNPNVRLAMTFDNESIFSNFSDTVAKDYSIYGNNGAITSATYTDKDAGVINEAMNFTPSSSLVRVSSFNGLNGKSNATIMGWVRQNSLSTGQYLLWGDGNVLIEMGSTQGTIGSSHLRVRWNLQGAWRNNHIALNSLDTDLWNHWAIIFSSGTTRIYKNGINIYNGSDTQTSISTSSPNYDIGTRGAGKLNGLIDEFVIMDSVLSPEEIAYFANINPFKEDSRNWNFAFNITNIPDGNYTYYGYARNDYQNFNVTDLRYINVDTSETLPPLITILSPQEMLYSTSSIDFNVSLDKASNWCAYSLDGAPNVTMNQINSTYYAITSTVSDGTRTVIFYCNSTFGLMGQSASRIFYVDTSPPIINYISPPTPTHNQIVLQNYTDIKLNISETSLYNFIYEWNKTNYTIYDSSLVLMMGLNNNSAFGENLSFIYDSSSYSNHGTFQGNANWSSNGKYGSAVTFDGTNDWIEISDDNSLDGMSQFTFEAWVYDTANDAQPRGIASKRVAASNQVAWGVFKYTSGFVNFDIGSDRTASNVALPTGRWVHLVVTYNASAPSGSRKKFYYDGVLVTTTSGPSSMPSTSSNLHIGILNANYSYGWQGFIDEVKIYNRTLDDSEILQNYKSNFFKQDANTWVFQANQTNLTDGYYDYRAFAGDNLGFNTSSTMRTVIIRTILDPPIILLNLPENESVLNYSSVNFNFTVTDVYEETLYCNFYVDEIQDLNFSVQNGTLTDRIISGIPDGYFLWNVSCINEINVTGWSENRNITIMEPPSIILNTSNNSWFYSDVLLQHTPFDNGNLENCSLLINDIYNQTDDTPTKENINDFIVQGLSQGYHNWSILCFDAFYNYNYSETYYFIVDNEAPSINLLNPYDGQEIYSSNIYFNFSVYDNLAEVLICNITVDDLVVDENFNATTNNITSRNVSILSGTHFWNVTCIDPAGNSVTSETRNFTNFLAPNVYLEEPEQNSWLNYSFVTLSYYVFDEDDNLANCSLFINGELNQTNYSVSNDNTNSFYVAFDEGYYNWSVSCGDYSNFSGNSETRSLGIDWTNPQISLYSPENNIILSDNNVTFNFSVTDNVADYLTCDIYINDFPEITLLNVSNGTLFNYSYILSDGFYSWYVECRDYALNIDVSEERNFTVIAPPVIDLIFPYNEYFTNVTFIDFEYIPYDSQGLVLCTLYVDDMYIANETTILNNQPNYFNNIIISEGKHNWSVECIDADLNVEMPQPNNFTIDQVPPAIVLNSPVQDYYSVKSTLDFNWTAYDSLSPLLYCDFILNGSVNVSNIQVNESVPYVLTLNGIGDGLFDWGVICSDQANNTNQSELRNFTVQEPPSVQLGNPVHELRSNLTTQTFFFIPWDNSGQIQSCTIIINGVANETLNTILNAQENNITVNGLTNGAYNWDVNCTDFSGNTGNNVTGKIIYIDLQGPYIELGVPEEGETFNQNDIFFNWTAYDFNSSVLLTCELFVSDPLGDRFIDNLTAFSGVTINYTVLNLSDGFHTWNVTCYDDLGNYNYSETRTFNINQPDLYIDNNRISFSNLNPDILEIINITANVSNIGGLTANNVLVEFWNGDPGLGGIFIGNDTATVLFNSSTIFRTEWSIPPGYHEIFVLVDPYNTIGELNETNNNASTNISAFYVNITYPENNTQTNENTPRIDFNISDFTGELLNYTVYVNNAPNGQSGQVNDGENTSINLNALSDGIHTVVVQGIDGLNRLKNSTPVTIIVDTTAPFTQFITNNASWYNVNNVDILFNISDNFSTTLDYKVFLNDVLNEINATTSGAIVNKTFTSLSEGQYVVIVEATDELGNVGNSTALYFFLDLTPPNENIVTQNETWFNTGNPQIQFNLTDNMDLVLNYSVFVNGTLNISGTANNASITPANLIGLTNGSHEIVVQALDEALNSQNSSSIIIYVDTVTPFVELNYPGNDTNHTTSVMEFNFTVTDNMADYLLCNLTLDGSVIGQNIQALNGVVQNFTFSGLVGGYHYWNVSCIDRASNRGISDTWRFYILQPDIYVNSSEIYFSNIEPTENETVEVTATIRNIGNTDAGNFIVQFWRGNPQFSGIQLNGNFVINLTSGESRNLSANFTVPIGIHEIFVLADTPIASNGSVSEEDETNNVGSRNITVGLWHFAFGNTNDRLVMNDQTLNLIFDWSVDNSSGSNLFVADIDSEIDWSQLQALGRDSLNVSSPSDFELLDEKLNATSLLDSINRTFTSGGAPIETMTFEVFRNIIENIPVTNSTNNTNFKTGILWDMSSGGNQYNGSQDVVFISNIQNDLMGYNQTVDFEIRIPATLRQYKGPDLEKIAFYIQIK